MISPKALVQSLKLRPKKSWGQNFLIHRNSAEKILRWANLPSEQTVLEVGPGLGALTEILLENGHHVIALEKDPKLFEYLQARWPQHPRLDLVQQDALKTNYKDLLSKQKDRRVWFISNLPYAISSPLLEKFLSVKNSIHQMVLLLQDEVVKRITALPGTKDYGRLTIWVQTLCQVEPGIRLKPGSFFPEPEVSSKLVRLSPRETPLVPEDELSIFLKLVAYLFQNRRKSIRKSLKKFLPAKKSLETILKKADLLGQERPETLSIQKLHHLSRLTQIEIHNQD